MYEIHNAVSNLQRLVNKEQKKVRDEKSLKDVEELAKALEKFSGYKVSCSGTLVSTGKR